MSKKRRPNPSLQPTATSRGPRHQVTVNSITPSRLLLSHPARRRSILELAGVFSQVAVAELFRQPAMFIEFGEIVIAALVAVGLFSIVVRRRGKDGSTWPTWFLLLIGAFLAVPMFVRVANPLRSFQFTVFAIVLSRWTVALVRRERNYGWAFYLVILIAAQMLIYPLANWYAGRS